MNQRQWSVSTGMAVMALTMVVANAVLFMTNRSTQGEIAGRAQFVQQSVQLEGLFNDMARALAELSARSNDEQLKALLGNVGITYTVNPPAAPAPQGKTK